jgi:hypothetical protein
VVPRSAWAAILTTATPAPCAPAIQSRFLRFVISV